MDTNLLATVLVGVVQIGGALAWLGVAIYVWTRTNSLGGVLLVLHGFISAGNMVLWRFVLPLFARSGLNPGQWASFSQIVGTLTTLLSYALLIGGVLLLVRDLRARPAT